MKNSSGSVVVDDAKRIAYFRPWQVPEQNKYIAAMNREGWCLTNCSDGYHYDTAQSYIYGRKLIFRLKEIKKEVR